MGLRPGVPDSNPIDVAMTFQFAPFMMKTPASINYCITV